jgi:hypothetical protein
MIPERRLIVLFQVLERMFWWYHHQFSYLAKRAAVIKAYNVTKTYNSTSSQMVLAPAQTDKNLVRVVTSNQVDSHRIKITSITI